MSNASSNETKVQILVADPSALGLFGLSMVTLVAASAKLGWTSGLSLVIPWAIILGGAAQLIACVYDFKHNNLFGATAFGAYGLFWIAVAACWMVKLGVFGPALASQVDVRQLGVAFVGYTLFSLFMTVAALETNKVLFGIMVLIDVLLSALAIDAIGGGVHAAHVVAAWSELTISLLGFYAAAAAFLNKFAGRVVLPVGAPFGILKPLPATRDPGSLCLFPVNPARSTPAASRALAPPVSGQA